MGKQSNEFVRKSRSRAFGTFTNSSGLTFKIAGLSPLEVPRIQASVMYPKKPTYRVETIGGGYEEHEHDVKVVPATETEPQKVVSTLETDADKAAWADYEAAVQKADQDLSERVLRTCLIDGVILTEECKADMERWAKRQTLKGIPVPTDPDELELAYKTSVVGQTSEDFELLMDLIMSLTGVREEEIDKLKRSFPDSV